MIYPIAAIAILWLILSRTAVATRWLPKVLPRITDRAGAIAAVLAALLMLVHGNVGVALCFFGGGLWLLGRSSGAASPAPAAKTRLSRVRSAMIEMDYDQTSGAVSGRIIAGAHEGTTFDRLSRTECEAVYAVCRRQDPDGARLLEAYLHRRFAGWRPAGEGDRDAREQRARSTSRMSEDEAYEVLGLRGGATREEIVRSHRTVMKRWHPDQGGTSELAARANEAKEVLLRRHA